MAFFDFRGTADVDENEATDLALHVRQCERRFLALNTKLNFILLILMLYALGAPESMRATFFSWMK